MEYAIIGLVAFVLGVAVGLWCKHKAYDDGYYYGYGKGYCEAYVEYLKKRMEGKS